MNQPFFVTGLPRSRTAWLANFLTHGAALCVHEGTIWGQTRLVNWLKNGVHRGVSDSCLPMFWEEILPNFSNFRLIIVHRDSDVCWQSLVGFHDREEIRVPGEALDRQFSEIRRSLNHMAAAYPHLPVDFDNLNDPETLEDIWAYCTHGLPYDSERTKLLLRLNIQQQVSAVRSSL